LRATLSGAAFEEYAGRFVWLELNLDRPENAPFLLAHDVGGIPVLYVLDGQGEVRATWAGSANAEQLARFLQEGERAAAGAPVSGPEAWMRRGDELLAALRQAEAAAAYREAARRGGRSWKRRPAAIDAEATALQAAQKYRQCAALALREAPRLPRARQRVTVTTTGLFCALAGGDAPWARRAQAALETLAREAVEEPSGLVDDRGMLYQGIHRLRQRAGDAAGARRAAEEWLASLDELDGVAPDPSPDERASRDGCRLQAALLIGAAARAVPALEASARAAPDDFSAHMRLASAYEGAGRPDDALASVARGLALSPGPEGRTRLLIVRGSAQAKAGDRAASARTFEEALQAAAGIANRGTREAMVQRIDALRGRL